MVADVGGCTQAGSEGMGLPERRNCISFPLLDNGLLYTFYYYGLLGGLEVFGRRLQKVLFNLRLKKCFLRKYSILQNCTWCLE